MEIGKWINHQYGSGASIQFVKGVSVSIMRDAYRPKGDTSPPYIVNMLGMRLEKRFNDFEEAKQYAVEMLKEHLEFALGFVNVYLNKK